MRVRLRGGDSEVSATAGEDDNDLGGLPLETDECECMEDVGEEDRGDKSFAGR